MLVSFFAVIVVVCRVGVVVAIGFVFLAAALVAAAATAAAVLFAIATATVYTAALPEDDSAVNRSFSSRYRFPRR